MNILKDSIKVDFRPLLVCFLVMNVDHIIFMRRIVGTAKKKFKFKGKQLYDTMIERKNHEMV